MTFSAMGERFLVRASTAELPNVFVHWSVPIRATK
jgi:hypothetical protein